MSSRAKKPGSKKKASLKEAPPPEEKGNGKPPESTLADEEFETAIVVARKRDGTLIIIGDVDGLQCDHKASRPEIIQMASQIMFDMQTVALRAVFQETFGAAMAAARAQRPSILTPGTAGGFPGMPKK